MPELDLGNVKGPQGKSAYQSALDAGYSGSEEAFNKAMAKAPDAVFYTAQNLTDEQQAQARGNINAAPGGFGLGNSEPRYATTDAAGPYSADTITETCFFVAKTNTPTGDWSYGICISRRQNNKIQIMWSEQGSGPWECDGCYAERIMKAGIWGPWEWVNPPMILGTEYRTTERYLGKPVYCKVLEVSPITDGGTITIEAVQTLRISVCEVVYADNFIPVPQVPFQMTSSSLPNSYGMAYYVNVNVIVFVRGAKNSSSKAVVTVYYTK